MRILGWILVVIQCLAVISAILNEKNPTIRLGNILGSGAIIYYILSTLL